MNKTPEQLYEDIQAYHDALNSVLSMFIAVRGTDYNCVDKGLQVLALHPELPIGMDPAPLVDKWEEENG